MRQGGAGVYFLQFGMKIIGLAGVSLGAVQVGKRIGPLVTSLGAVGFI